MAGLSAGPVAPEIAAGIAAAGKDGAALRAARVALLEAVKKHMALLAPNTTALVGGECAAGLVGAAGSLALLSKMNGGAVAVLGREQQSHGNSGGVTLRLTTGGPPKGRGVIFMAPIVQNVPEELQSKGACAPHSHLQRRTSRVCVCCH